MRNVRLKFMLHLYGWSSKVYANLFKANKKAWGISKDEFLRYPVGSLGYQLGEFYALNGFDIMPKLENHDVFHILTETGITIQDEIGMQYLLFGNGKFSFYLMGMIVVGGMVFPEYFGYYIQSFLKGRSMMKFHSVDFKALLTEPIAELRVYFKKELSIITAK